MADNKKVRVDQFANEFSAIVSDFEREIDRDLKKDMREAAKVAREEVKKEPAGAGVYRDWDSYSEGWRYKTEEKFGGYNIRIYNSKKPGLTHLLEKGHINRDGKTRARAFPHIAPAAEKAFEELDRRFNNG